MWQLCFEWLNESTNLHINGTKALQWTIHIPQHAKACLPLSSQFHPHPSAIKISHPQESNLHLSEEREKRTRNWGGGGGSWLNHMSGNQHQGWVFGSTDPHKMTLVEHRRLLLLKWMDESIYTLFKLRISWKSVQTPVVLSAIKFKEIKKKCLRCLQYIHQHLPIVAPNSQRQKCWAVKLTPANVVCGSAGLTGRVVFGMARHKNFIFATSHF